LRWSLVPSYASIKTALEPVKLVECVGKGSREVVGRLTVQPVCLDQPGTGGSR
jgi:hypothetical protein